MTIASSDNDNQCIDGGDTSCLERHKWRGFQLYII